MKRTNEPRCAVQLPARFDGYRRRRRGGVVGLCSVAFMLAGVAAMPLAASAERVVAAAVNESKTGKGLVVGIRSVAPWDQLKPAIEVGENSTLRSAFGRVYSVSRTDETVSVIDADAWTLLQVVPTGAGSRPIDIAIVDPDTAYVTRRGATQLLRIDLNTWATAEVIDLSPLADVDGIPEMTWLIAHDGKLLIQLERFSDGDPYGFIPPAVLAVVDINTESLVDMDPLTTGIQGIELHGTAAKHKMQIVPQSDTLYVSASGTFHDEGGLESVDLTTLQTNGLFLEEADGRIGADLGSFVLTRPTGGYLVFSTDLIESSHLVDFTTAGFVDSDSEIISIVEYRVPTILHDIPSDTIFLPQGGYSANGVHVFTAADATRLTTDPIPLPGTPTDLVFVCDAAGACGEPEPACPESANCTSIPVLDPVARAILAVLLALTATFVFFARERFTTR